MSDDRINIEFSCKACGASPATLALPDDHTDDSIAKCKSCGADVGRYGDIKAAAIEAAKGEMSAALKGVFKGLKGWKIG